MLIAVLSSHLQKRKSNPFIPFFTFDLWFWDESLNGARGRRRAAAGVPKYLLPFCSCKSGGQAFIPSGMMISQKVTGTMVL
jgi:hypothetical protein